MKHPHPALALASLAARYLRLFSTGLALAVVAAAVPATAATLPMAATFVQCFADGNNAFHATECAQGSFPGVPPSAFASATLSPFPSVAVEVIAPPATVLGAGADANATYWFQVTGGTVGDTVPVLFDFALSAVSSPESSALARLIIRTSVVPFTVEELVCNPLSCDETTFSDTVSVQARSGSTLDSVTLYVLAQAPVTGVSHESARAFADPYIYVDPAFTNASLYSIVVSPGVANVPLSPVPEPSPVTLWLAGSLLIAVALARRRPRECRTGGAAVPADR
jgi:hypothetical protein